MFGFFKKKKDEYEQKLQNFFKPAPQTRTRDVVRELAHTVTTPQRKVQKATKSVATGMNNLFNPNTAKAKQNKAYWAKQPTMTKQQAKTSLSNNTKKNHPLNRESQVQIPLVQAYKQRSIKPLFDKKLIASNIKANISDPYNAMGGGMSNRLSKFTGRIVNKAMDKGVSRRGVDEIIKRGRGKQFIPQKPAQQSGRTAQSLPNRTQYKQENPSYRSSNNYTPNVPQKEDIANAIKTTPWRKVVRNMQDSMESVGKLTKVKGVKVTDANDPYLAETLFHGRVGARMEKAMSDVKNIDEGLTKLNTKDVDDYLKALHAPERNAVLGDGASGMTNKQAGETINKLRQSKNFKEIEGAANEIKNLHSQTLDLMKDSGLVSEELYTQLRTQYKNHVPLNRIMEDTEDLAGFITGGKGRSVKSSGLKRAKGSDKEVADIMTNVTTNLQEAIIRAEKNKYGQSVLKFARENEGLDGLFKIEKPQAIGKGFDDHILKAIKNEKDALVVMENGKPTVLRINDEALAEALRGVSVESLPHGFQTIGAVTRMYASLATRFNPDFAFSNVTRDVQEMMVYMGAENGAKSALKTPLKVPKSAGDVIAGIYGKNTPGAKLYNQMIMDGGTTGGMGLSTRKQIELNMDKIRKLNRSKPKKALNTIIESIDNWNQVFEDSTRLSAYKDALDRGLSRPRAAQIAKESTINFNRKGKGTSMLNALYMFSNASIQGSTKMVKAMKDPKVAATVTASVAVPTMMFNEWNDRVDPEWRDKVKSYERAKHLIIVSPHQDENGDFEYIKIPVGWGISPIKTTVDVLDDIRQGHTTGLKGVSDVVTSILEAYNPIGGSSLMQAVTPTVGDVPVDIYANKNWYGGDLHPEFKKGKANKDQYFSSLDKTATGKASIKATDTMFNITGGAIDISPASLNYAINSYASGAGRFIGRTTNLFKDIGADHDLPAQETPFINRFYKEVAPDEQKMDYAKRDEFYKKIRKIDPETPEYQQAIREYLMQAKDQEEYEALKGSLYWEDVSTKGISSQKAIEEMKPMYDKVQKALEAGDHEGAKAMIESLSPSGVETYGKLKTNKKREATTQARENLGETFSTKKVKERQTKLFNEKMNKLKEMDEWKNASGDDREKIVKKFSTKSKHHAVAQMVQENSQGMNDEELKSYLGDLKKAGILNKTIFELYMTQYKT